MLKSLLSLFRGSPADSGDPETVRTQKHIVTDQSPQQLFEQAGNLFDRGDSVTALDQYLQTVKLDPSFYKAHVMAGFIYKDRGNLSQAKQHLQTAIKIVPHLADAHYLLGAIAAIENQEELMRSHFAASLAHDPQQEQIYREFSFAEFQLGRPLEAIAIAQQGLTYFPENLPLLQYLGNFYLYSKHYEEASQTYRKALQQEPNSVDLLYNLAICCTILLRYAEGQEALQKILAIDPNHVMAHFERGILLLQQGDYAQGWKDFEWRWSTPHLKQVKFKTTQAKWDGSQDLNGKTILILSEQGYGDTIQFCRFIPQLKSRGAIVHFVVLKPLIELMQQVPGVDRLFDEQEALPPYDYYCELMSLPFALQSTLENLPAPDHYLSAPVASVQAWQTRFDDSRSRRVGIVWSGNPSHTNNHLRSIPLEIIQPLFSQEFEFVVLQKELSGDERRLIQQYPNLKFFGEQVGGFADTAALIELVDVVITVDTSVAHLAGAMGKKTWVLVSHHSDWRWLLEREDSPWYPSVRLFRQQYGESWAVVVDKLAQQLLVLEQD